MGLLDTLRGAYESAKSAIQGPAQQAADTTGLSDINPPGVAPESSGMTTTGGKRGRKTRRSKKTKKTVRRKH